MHLEALPTLLDLAVQNLLRAEALAASALEDLPGELFPPPFKEAFACRKSRILRATVAAWPFPCIPLESLMQTDDLETLKVALDGLDDLLKMKVCPRRCKLQGLDLRNVHQNFWKAPLSGGTPSLPVRWAWQRKSSLQLHCKKMEIWALPVNTVVEILKIFQPDSIEELELNALWELEALACFTPYLGQMRNLRRFLLAGVYKTVPIWGELSPEMENFGTQFFSQSSKLRRLQVLSMNGVYFLKGHLKEVLSSLKIPVADSFRTTTTPLEMLQITQCSLSQADLNYLSQWPVTIQHLKHLGLSGVLLFHVCARPLRILLETVSATLETLKLEDCRMGHSQVRVLPPVLTRCFQLTTINFLENDVAAPVLKGLLHLTCSLRQLTLELYPAPREVHDSMGGVDLELFVHLCPQLMDTLKAIRQPKSACFAADPCRERLDRWTYNQETKLCISWKSGL
uniref:PRAME family member 12-like n=1 Tax=Jaculus jaculus TaxID=51337 RepID=UPI001E1AF677|nr:PRAME family member 12-like [Jaculus jaculus]